MGTLTTRERLKIADLLLQKQYFKVAALDDVMQFLSLPDAAVEITEAEKGHIKFQVYLHPHRFTTSATFREYLSQVTLPKGDVRYAGLDGALGAPKFRYRHFREEGYCPDFWADFTGHPGGLTLSTDPKVSEVQKFFSGGRELSTGRVFYRFT